MRSENTASNEERVAGWLLAGSTALAVLLLAQHPTEADGPMLARTIHGGILLFMLAQTIGFTLLVRARRGVWDVAGSPAFALAMIAGMGAGMVDGFIVPATLEHYPRAENPALFQALWEVNQALAPAGVLLTSIAYALWGVGYWRSGHRMTAVLAWGAAVIPAAVLLGGILKMNITGALAVYTIQASWAAWLGVAILSARANFFPSGLRD